MATALSIPLGYSTDQFLLRGGSSFTAGLLPAWLTLTLAPVVEELAWHGYGTYALASRWTIWKTSIVFAVIWALWHVPLGTIKGYYQLEVVETGALATVSFLVSVFPFVTPHELDLLPQRAQHPRDHRLPLGRQRRERDLPHPSRHQGHSDRAPRPPLGRRRRRERALFFGRPEQGLSG